MAALDQKKRITQETFDETVRENMEEVLITSQPTPSSLVLPVSFAV
jgi:hypothetical protein